MVRVADRIEGPYRRIGKDELLPADNLVFKPCEWQGQTLYFHNLRGVSDWSPGPNTTITSLAPPKVAEAAADGELILRPFRGWGSVANGPEETLAAPAIQSAGTVLAGDWTLRGGALAVEAWDGFAGLLLPEMRGAFILEVDLEAEGPGEMGVLFRSVDDGDDATFASVCPASRHVQVYTLAPSWKTSQPGVTYRWRGKRVVQETHGAEPWAMPLTLRVVAFGPYCEVSVNDRVALSAVTMARESGRLGFFAEDCTLAVRQVRLQPLRSPGR